MMIVLLKQQSMKSFLCKILIIFLLFFIVASAQATNGLWRSAKFIVLTAWGDSLTQDGGGITYPQALSALYTPARTVQNQGIGGEGSSQILVRFLALPTTWGNGTLIWSGRNNYQNSAQVQSDIATMVSDINSSHYVVMAIINGEHPNEYVGQSEYNKIIALNSALSATYGANYLDVRATLVAAYNPAIGPDVVDNTNDVPPYSLRSNTFLGTFSGNVGISDTAFTLSPTSGTVISGTILAVGSEYIFVTTIVGNSVTVSTRGYAGSTAAAYSSGTSYVGTDPLHLNPAGYSVVAQAVYAKIQTLGAW